ncbi:MAG: flavin reductase family protein [Chloroflexota bacterium]
MPKTYLPDDGLHNAIYLMQPSRPVLVTTRNADGSVNVAPFSWVAPVSMCPPMVALALLTRPRKQHTLTNIERGSTFVVNLPNLDIAARMVRTSYRFPAGTDKFAEADFHTEPSRVAEVPGVAECRSHVECRAAQFVPTGDHTLVIADVVAASYDSDLFDENFLLRVDRVSPCIHLRQSRDRAGQTHIFLEAAGLHSIEVPYQQAVDPNTTVEHAEAAVEVQI